MIIFTDLHSQLLPGKPVLKNYLEKKYQGSSQIFSSVPDNRGVIYFAAGSNILVYDGLTWSHVSDLEGWNNSVGKLYGVRSIPHTMLVDPEGVIMAHKLDTDGLEKKLEEIFSKE